MLNKCEMYIQINLIIILQMMNFYNPIYIFVILLLSNGLLILTEKSTSRIAEIDQLNDFTLKCILKII